MKDPTKPVRIDPDAIYDDGALVLTLGLTHAAIATARRSGQLRYTRNRRIHSRIARYSRRGTAASAQLKRDVSGVMNHLRPDLD